MLSYKFVFASEHSCQLADDESHCNVMHPTTLPKEKTSQVLDPARSTAQNVRPSRPAHHQFQATRLLDSAGTIMYQGLATIFEGGLNTVVGPHL